jgi:hypothetical protein
MVYKLTIDLSLVYKPTTIVGLWNNVKSIYSNK